VVWATKYRYKVLQGPMRERIREIIRQTCAELGVHIIKGVLARDHVHMFINVPPKLALSTVIQRIKGRSSRRVQMEFPELRKRYWGSGSGRVDIFRRHQATSPTISYFSIWNCIPSVMLPASAGSRSLGECGL